MDNSLANTADWTRSVGIGYFNPNGIVPRSFLHINTEFSLLPQNGSIAGLSETFRTTVAAGQNQQWRMERGNLEIGRLWHGNPGNAFHIQASQATGNLLLENSNNDGIRVNQNGVASVLLNGFSLDRNGYVAIGSSNAWNFLLTPNGPWSRLHLVHPDQGATAPNFAYRPWMTNGLTATGQSDLLYMGQKFIDQNCHDPEQDDNTVSVIAWGDDDLPAGLGHAFDNFQFRFLGDPNLGNDEGTCEGFELLRLRPIRIDPGSPLLGSVGVGNWSNAGVMPEESLDVLDGTLRLRALIPNYQGSYDHVVVADSDGRMHWRPMSDFTGQTDCDWTQLGNNNLVTAHPAAATGCPGPSNKVGIGVNAPLDKLHVVDDVSGTTDRTGGRFEALNSTNINTGLVAQATGGQFAYACVPRAYDGADQNYAVFAKAITTTGSTTAVSAGVMASVNADAGSTISTAIGVMGGVVAGDGALINTSIGVRGYGYEGQNQNYGGQFKANGPSTVANYGLYGSATGGAVNFGIWASAPTTTTDWAAWFQGNMNVTGSAYIPSGVWIPSDADLKTNVQDLQNASALLTQLSPKTYDYLIADHPNASLPIGTQAGVMAQDLMALIPGLVTDISVPAKTDSLGNVLSPAETFKAINYTGLVPYLIAAFNEQSTRLNDLEQQVQDCCNAPDIDATPRSMQDGSGTLENDLFKVDPRLTIAPNPFEEQTTISYVLEGAGRVQLQVSNQGGLHIATLRDQQQEEGAYSLTWHTADLAPGTYIVTLFSDGAPVVKRAVKVK